MRFPNTNLRRGTRLAATMIAFLSLAALAFAIVTTLPTADPAHAQGGGIAGPTLRTLTITSAPAIHEERQKYGIGEVIKVKASFTEAVIVKEDTTPTLDLQVGDNTRELAYKRGSGTNDLIFTYTVQLTDTDRDGISMPSVDAREDDNIDWHLDIFGVNSRVNPNPSYNGFGNQSSHKVFGRLFPDVVSVRIITEPDANGYHTAGDVITAEFTLSAASDFNSDHEYYYHAQIGDNVRSFLVDGGSGTKRITASYTVLAEDIDNDGIQFKNSAGGSSGAGWTVTGTTYRFSIPSPLQTDDLTGHKVSGIPYIAGMEITSTPTYGDTYRKGDKITADVTFSVAVENTGGNAPNAYISLKVDQSDIVTGDGHGVIYLWYTSGDGTDTISVDNTVTDRHLDSDGLSFFETDNDHHQLGEARPTVLGTDDPINTYYPSSPALPDHKINGAARSTVQSVSVVSTPALSSGYNAGETIVVAVDFGETVQVRTDGSEMPELKLTVGSTEQTATFTGLTYRSNGEVVFDTVETVASDEDGPANAVMLFRYDVQSGDLDSNGVSIAANSITNGTAVVDLLGNPANTSTDAVNNQSAHKVEAAGPRVSSISITSDPGSDETYAIGDTVVLQVAFTTAVSVTGTPQITLEFADSDTEGVAQYSATDGANVSFSYTIAEGDESSDGVGLVANSLTLNGGTIQDSGGTAAIITHSAVDSYVGHFVDGIRPAIRSGTVSSNGRTVSIRFTERVKLAPLLQWFIDEHDLPATASDFIHLVLNVEVDGAWPKQTNASISGNTVTVTMQTPITEGQAVTVRYDGVYAKSASNIIMDARGNAPSHFGPTSITNNSTVEDATGPAGITMSVRELKITEGESGSYTIALSEEPSGNVTVSLEANNPDNVTISATSLTFTTDNWDTPQTVTVSSTTDDNDYGYWVTIIHTASGSDYTGQDSIKIRMRE